MASRKLTDFFDEDVKWRDKHEKSTVGDSKKFDFIEGHFVVGGSNGALKMIWLPINMEYILF